MPGGGLDGELDLDGLQAGEVRDPPFGGGQLGLDGCDMTRGGREVDGEIFGDGGEGGATAEAEPDLVA
jgi:hypothetical protein